MKFDPKGCYNILLCIYVFLEKPPLKYVMFKFFFNTKNPYNVFNSIMFLNILSS